MVLACSGVCWAIAVLPLTAQETPFRMIGKRMAMREAFKRDTLDLWAAQLDAIGANATCNIGFLRGAILIRAQLAEPSASSGKAAEIDGKLGSLEAAARRALRCSPYQGMAWFALYWAAMNKQGLSSDVLSFLSMSYEVAPREAWIALMRNNYALQVANALPEEVQNRVIAEWADILRGGFLEIAAATLARAAPAEQMRLIAETANMDQMKLRWFSRYLGQAGLDIQLPTLDEREQRYVR